MVSCLNVLRAAFPDPRPEFLDDCIVRTAGKDREAFAQLYRSTSTAVYSYALSLLKNAYDAEDVMHDCYVRIFQSANSYRPSGKPMAWILTIARNLCLQKIGERKKKADIPEEDWERVLTDNPDLSVEERMLLETCMKMLTDEERQIVVLHSVAGFRHKEIASHMGLGLSTVLSKYSRAVKKLQAELTKEGGFA